MTFSLKSLIAEQKARDSELGQAGTEAPKSRPTHLHALGQESASIIFENDPAERSAIVELDGKVPPEWAAGFVSLMAMPRPRGVTYERWVQVINDAGLLLDHWGTRLVDLRWDTASVFSVPRDPSSSRQDQSGLAWLLKGCRVVAMTADHVGVEVRPGIVQRIYRRPDPVGGVVLWEMGSK